MYKNFCALSFICSILCNLWNPSYCLGFNVDTLEKEIKYIGIYFSHPKYTQTIPHQKWDIEYQANHRIIIKNKKKVDQLKNLVKGFVLDKEDSKGLRESIRFKVVFKYIDGDFVHIYIDLVGNFELGHYQEEFLTGKMTQADFIKFVNYCEEVQDIIDLGMQKRQLIK